jgi:histidinol-phosphate aminotransferase
VSQIQNNIAEPQSNLVDAFLLPSLQQARAYSIDTPPAQIKLDQNESPFDWPIEIKKRVLDRVARRNWQRYPSPFTWELNELLAKQLDVSPENIFTANGSNVILSILIATLTKKLEGKVVVARPSFAHYESTCRYEGISYEPWNLSEDFQYDISTLPELTPGSLVIFASPNNPVGNVLSLSTLDDLLTRHPQCLFVADEAYFEFVSEDYLQLLKRHANLIIVRTFSKTLGAAGVRIGYAVAAKGWFQHLHKLRLPYLINFFGLEAAKEILQNPELEALRCKAVELILTQRQRMVAELQEIANENFRIVPPHANFFLMQWKDAVSSEKAYRSLISDNILVRDVSKGPGLANCFRVTVGLPEENEAFVNSMRKIIKKV